MSEPWNPGIQFAELSDVGMRRANNQDSISSLPAGSYDRYRKRGHLFVVADGMGAHAAGELASSIATERIAMYYFRSSEPNMTDALRSSIVDANDEIHKRGQSNPEFHQMGTTASALVLAPEGAIVGHVGDSRVYRLRGNTLEQLTADHSLVWEMEASGQSGINVPKNVITRSLGPHPEVQVDIEGPFPTEPGDCFLVCSDGLTGLVEDSELGPLLGCLPESTVVRMLVDLANLRGGPDNISLIVARVDQQPTPQDSRISKQDRSKRLIDRMPLPIVVMSGVCLLAGCLMGLMGNYGPMAIAFGLGVICFIVAYVQANEGQSPAIQVQPTPTRSPYRRYDARPTAKLYHKLGETVNELREAASSKNWMMDWQSVEAIQAEGDKFLANGQLAKAINRQAQAIIETMNQLREQNNRAASDTVIE